jgi:REP element-mobilizing transposase RayT
MPCRDLLAAETRNARVAFWAQCLMPDHVHLILTPADEKGLAQAPARAHRHYGGAINARTLRADHLFQERFSSAPVDEEHLKVASGYLSLNPARARLVERAADWPSSSVGTHLGRGDDGLTDVAPSRARIARFADLIETDSNATTSGSAAFAAKSRTKMKIENEVLSREAVGLLPTGLGTFKFIDEYPHNIQSIE